MWDRNGRLLTTICGSTAPIELKVAECNLCESLHITTRSTEMWFIVVGYMSLSGPWNAKADETASGQCCDQAVVFPVANV